MSDYPNYQPPYTPAAQTSGLATASLVSGILSWFLLPLLGAIIAVITGHAAKNEIRNSGGRVSGDGMATVGLILGYAQLGLTVLGVCVGAVLLATGVCATIPFLGEWNY